MRRRSGRFPKALLTFMHVGVKEMTEMHENLILAGGNEE